MVLSRIFVVSVCVLGLAACSSKAPLPPCPQVAILRALERYEDYGKDTPDKSTLVAVARMDSVNGTCRYRDDGIYIDFALSMRAAKGPRLGGDQLSLPFFVAVVDGKGTVLRKETMTAAFSFKEEGRATLVQDLHVMLPHEDKTVETDQRVLIGFQLDAEHYERAVEFFEQREALR